MSWVEYGSISRALLAYEIILGNYDARLELPTRKQNIYDNVRAFSCVLIVFGCSHKTSDSI